VILLENYGEIVPGSHLDTSVPSIPALILRYSPECVEVEFSEVRIQDRA
jgi:hypothetical protein